MANKQRGEVEIKLDIPRKLKFGMRALAELEDSLGYSLSKMGEDVGIKTMIKMVRCGLLHELPNLTEDEAADLMDYSTIEIVSKKISEALELQFGGNKEKKTRGLSGVGKS